MPNSLITHFNLSKKKKKRKNQESKALDQQKGKLCDPQRSHRILGVEKPLEILANREIDLHIK